MSSGNLRTRINQLVSMAIVLLISSPAMAGASSSTIGAGVGGMLGDIVDFMRGPIMISVATLVFILIVGGAWFSGGQDAIKKVIGWAFVTAAIIAAPTIVLTLVNSAGAVI